DRRETQDRRHCQRRGKLQGQQPRTRSPRILRHADRNLPGGSGMESQTSNIFEHRWNVSWAPGNSERGATAFPPESLPHSRVSEDVRGGNKRVRKGDRYRRYLCSNNGNVRSIPGPGTSPPRSTTSSRGCKRKIRRPQKCLPG